MSRFNQIETLDSLRGGDPLDEVVADCLEGGPEQLEAALDRACGSHPGSAVEIRRRIAVLRNYGLLDQSGAAAESRCADQLGGFRLLERLGDGGMGIVFRARQEALNREVALKLIRPEQLRFPLARERFRRETEAAARLSHPGIVPIYTVGEENGIPFFAMELVNGSTLADAVRELRANNPDKLAGADLARALQHCASKWMRWNALAADAAFRGSYAECVLRLVVQVAEALHHAHERGVLHRDVKPANLAVTDEARALLFDFGLASLSDAPIRLTMTRSELGSLAYMSPEQLRGSRTELDRRCDVYSLGVTLYELLALRLPFAQPDPLELRRAILEGAFAPLRSRNSAVSRELEIVCAKAMERDAARRYDDAGAFARDLRNVLEQRPIEARPASKALLLRRSVQRHPIAATALAAAIALPSALWWQNSAHARELGRALEAAQFERKAAQQEAHHARALNSFLVEIFSSVDPAYAQGKEVTARDLLDVAAQRLQTELVSQPRERSKMMTTVGESYASLGELERAETILMQALDLHEELGLVECLEYAQALRAIASLETHLTRAGAVEHARTAAQLHRRLAPEPSFELADSLLCYARALSTAKQLDDADRVYIETLAVIEALPGDQRPGRIGVLANLAQVQADRGQHETALASANEVVRLQRSIALDPHPAIATGLEISARALTQLGRLDEARLTFDELLGEERGLTGEASLRFATCLSSKSTVELRAGRVPDAIELLERASAIMENTAAPTHGAAVEARERLGTAYQRALRWQDSIAVFESLLGPVDSVCPPGAPRPISVRVRLARSHEALSQWDALESELDAALAIAREANSPGDDGVESQAAAGLARSRLLRGDLEGAKALMATSLELCGAATLSTTAGAWTRLADAAVARAAGNIDRAREVLEPLVKLEFGPLSAEFVPAIARANLAALLQASDPGRARQLAERASAELEQGLGKEHPETRAARAVLESLR